MKLYESGAIKEVIFHDDGQWDSSGVIWLSQVFVDEDD
jgi:hypothetical protein